MPRNVTRGRAAPEGGVTAAMAGTGWVFGYGIVTPVSPLALAALCCVAIGWAPRPGTEGSSVFG